MLKKKPAVTARRSALDDAKKEQMLAILVRNKQAFESVRETLEIKHLRPMGQAHAAVWREVQKFYDEYSELPDKGNLLTSLHQACADNPDMLDEDELLVTEEFVEYAFDNKEHGKDIAKSNAHYRVALNTCRKFLEEYHTFELSEQLVQNGQIVTDIMQELDRKRTEIELAQSLTQDGFEEPFPPGWDQHQQLKLFTTGLTVLDDFFGGGWTRDEVIIFMGPYGSCKTTMVCHACAELVKIAASRHFRLTAQQKKKKVKKKIKRQIVVLIFTEGSKHDYRVRLLSHLARVPWKKLSQMSSMEALSKTTKQSKTKEAYDPYKLEGIAYEKVEFAHEIKDGLPYNCEYVRVKKAAAMCNKFLYMIDCTDSKDSQQQIGKGGIPEIANVVRAYFRKNKDCKPLCFWLDHASALADRIVEATEFATPDMARTVLKRIPRQCKDKLVRAFKAPVAIMHQLSGAANAKTTTSRQHHTDAAECKAIAEYVDFAVVTGIPDNRQMSMFSCTKHRREPPTPIKVVEIVGRFNRLVDRSNTHVVSGNSILSHDELGTQHANDAIAGNASDKYIPKNNVAEV